MKFLLSTVILLMSNVCLANWVVNETKWNSSVSINYVKGAEGEKDIESVLKLMKNSGQLNKLDLIGFPDFSRDDEYQKRIKEALLKVAPEEAKKIFTDKEVKPWNRYNALERRLKDAYLELEEFKNLESALKKWGYKLGYVSAEKFSYTDFQKTGEFRLNGISPYAQVLAYSESEDSSKVKLSLGEQVMKGDKYYVRFNASSMKEDILIKGKWSSDLKGYLASKATLYQHDGNGWAVIREVDLGISNVLKFKENGGNNLYIELKEKLKPVNTMIEMNIEGEKIYSRIDILK